MGDLGQTANSTQTVAGLVGAAPHVLINVGDYSCGCGGWQDARGAGDACCPPHMLLLPLPLPLLPLPLLLLLLLPLLLLLLLQATHFACLPG